MGWSWKLRSRTLRLGDEPRIMGILNVTPDSFSDGGRHSEVEAALSHARRLVDDGADILDVGGESTRPGASEVPVDVERARVVPIIQRLVDELDVPISVDTRKAPVAREALAAGAEIVNDVSGLRFDPQMAGVVGEAGAGLVIMHARGTPESMQDDPRYGDLIDEVRAWFAESLAIGARDGVRAEQVVLDPGIGFGKRLEHNLGLLASPDAFSGLDRPLLVGASRKSMFLDLLGLGVDDREEATLAVSAVSAFLGVAIIRVHEVRGSVRAARVGRALARARIENEPTRDGDRE